MIWAAMTSQHLFGPYFFEGSVNATNYLHTLRTWLIPQLEELGLIERMWLLRDGAPAHFALPVCEFLSEHFHGWWIGRGSPATPAPLKWPPRSPDLTTPDNSLLGVIKVYICMSLRYKHRTTQFCSGCISHYHTRHTPKHVKKKMEAY